MLFLLLLFCCFYSQLAVAVPQSADFLFAWLYQQLAVAVPPSADLLFLEFHEEVPLLPVKVDLLLLAPLLCRQIK